ncbi:MAG TPA: TonB-dependent receptor [Thermoanaerobaculia bacterium]|nr:TonB-dependent receptor [Thermoanaerobaculia bacterium]
MKYRLNLFSNFTYFLDDPVNGDQFEQADDRLVAGFRASHRWLARWGSVSADEIRQFSGGVYAQTPLQWSRWLRTVAGIRGDRYRINGDASIVSPKLAMIFGPWRNTELYANAGSGFHSNDARADSATPLVRTRGAEIGLRTTPIPRFHMTASLWGLDMASERAWSCRRTTTSPAGWPLTPITRSRSDVSATGIASRAPSRAWPRSDSRRACASTSTSSMRSLRIGMTTSF